MVELVRGPHVRHRTAQGGDAGSVSVAGLQGVQGTDDLERLLDAGPHRYLWLDALSQRLRKKGRIQQVSVVVATAVNCDGKREVLGIDVGTSGDGAFRPAFLRGLVARGLTGVEILTSDAHRGMRAAIAAVFGRERARYRLEEPVAGTG